MTRNKEHIVVIKEASNGYIVEIAGITSVHHTIANVMDAVQDALAASTPILEGVKHIQLKLGKKYRARNGQVYEIKELSLFREAYFGRCDLNAWWYLPNGQWDRHTENLNSPSEYDLVEEVK